MVLLIMLNFLYEVLDVGDVLSLQVVANLSVNNTANLFNDEDVPFANLSSEDIAALIPPHLRDITVVFVSQDSLPKKVCICVSLLLCRRMQVCLIFHQF